MKENIKNVPGLTDQDAVIFCRFGRDFEDVLFEQNSEITRKAASLTKILLGAEIARMLHSGEINNDSLVIVSGMLAGYGTDVLSDLYNKNNKLILDVRTLVYLMIKYSCNSSTLVLDRKFFKDRERLEKVAKSYWGLKDPHLKYVRGSSGPQNELSIKDIYFLYRKIFTDRSKWMGFIRESLYGSRSLYRLFDQQQVSLSGSKSGTVKDGDEYWIGDSGVVEANGKLYFLGGVFKDKVLSRGVVRMREVGRFLLTMVDQESK